MSEEVLIVDKQIKMYLSLSSANCEDKHEHFPADFETQSPCHC
jgi:hypothetical protein